MTLFGIAVAEGGVVVTTGDVLRGALWIDMVGSGGRLQRATVAATDSGSDLALVDVPVDVPVAPFSDDGSLSTGTTSLTLGLVPDGSAGLALHSSPATVTSVATAIASGPARGLAGIIASMGASGTPGEPLLDKAGAVVGILCDPATATSSRVPWCSPSPTTCARRAGFRGVSSGSRGPTPPGSPEPSSRRCARTGGPPVGSNTAR